MAKSKVKSKMLVDITPEWNPDYAVPPGDIIMEHMEVRGWGLEELSRKTFIEPEKLYWVLKGEAIIEPAIALGLEHALGIKADIWIGIDAQWQDFKADTIENPL